jgi:Cys-tRNA(Pro) deacylase
MMSTPPPVSQALTALGIPHEVFYHTNPVRSLEQAATERGQRPAQVVRSILFRVSEGEYLLVLVAGPQQVDWKTLRRQVGTNRLTMADKDEVLAVTGYPIGAVGPFGLAQAIPILVDETVWQEEWLSLGSGVHNVAIILKRQDLLSALGTYDTCACTQS